MGLPHIIFNKSNKTLWSTTLSGVWFNTVRDFDWTLTRFIWLEIIHLHWEAEKMNRCATRMHAFVGQARRGWVLPLNPHTYGSFSLLCCRWLDCESFTSYRLFASSSPGLLRSLFVSLPWAYIQKSSVSLLLLLRFSKNTTSSVARWFSLSARGADRHCFLWQNRPK
jgi:hypothetical protein